MTRRAVKTISTDITTYKRVARLAKHGKMDKIDVVSQAVKIAYETAFGTTKV